MSLPEIDIALELFSLPGANRECPLPIKGRDGAVANSARLRVGAVRSAKVTAVTSPLPQARGERARSCLQCAAPTRIGASSDIPTRYQTKTASSATGMPISEVQT